MPPTVYWKHFLTDHFAWTCICQKIKKGEIRTRDCWVRYSTATLVLFVLSHRVKISYLHFTLIVFFAWDGFSSQTKWAKLSIDLIKALQKSIHAISVPATPIRLPGIRMGPLSFSPGATKLFCWLEWFCFLKKLNREQRLQHSGRAHVCGEKLLRSWVRIRSGAGLF